MTMPVPGPKPSRTRATASFLTGFMLFGGGPVVAYQEHLDAPPDPERARVVTVAMLWWYASWVVGAVAGWVYTGSGWGVFFIACAGAMAGALTMWIPVVILMAIRRAIR